MSMYGDGPTVGSEEVREVVYNLKVSRHIRRQHRLDNDVSDLHRSSPEWQLPQQAIAYFFALSKWQVAK